MRETAEVIMGDSFPPTARLRLLKIGPVHLTMSDVLQDAHSTGEDPSDRVVVIVPNLLLRARKPLEPKALTDAQAQLIGAVKLKADLERHLGCR
jgi:hypothetical protein